jgi:hypothetical protein
MNDVKTIDLNIEVLDHRVELMAAAAGTCSTTSCCSSTAEDIPVD